MANQSRKRITIDNFDTAISDQDFSDLTNITKDDFRKLRDGFEYEEDGEQKHFGGVFDKYRFNASIDEFVLEKNNLGQYWLGEQRDIFELIPNQKNNQIFTPKKVVKMMVDALEKEQPQLFDRTDSTFIDLYMKSGLYITEIVKRLFTNTRKFYPSDYDCVKHILENQVFGLAPSNILHNITNELIFGFDTNHTISTQNFQEYDLLPDAKAGTAHAKLQQLFTHPNLMKGENSMFQFDAVVGNPPYQETIGKSDSQTQGNSTWVYYHFQNVADKIGHLTCLIYPFGGWFDSPASFGQFGKKLLSDKHTIFIYAFEGTSDKRAWYRNDKRPHPIFEDSANLSAGVAIVLRDNIGIYNTYEFSNRMYSDTKVKNTVTDWKKLISQNPDFIELSEKLSGQCLKPRIRKGIFGIESDYVQKNPSKVSQHKSDWPNPIRILTNNKSGSSGRATWYWADQSIITQGAEYLNKYKVVCTSAYPKQKFASGKPTIKNVKARAKELIEIMPKGSAFGRSKMSLLMSDSKTDCDNFLKYTNTNFFGFLLLQEPNRRSTFGDVILDQDFTSNSDIDWTKSIEEIDRQLYKKYGLTKEEISFIESRVEPME
jgi:hypothetical protein